MKIGKQIDFSENYRPENVQGLTSDYHMIVNINVVN